MAQHCLIHNGKVIQLEASSFEVSSPLFWEIDVTDTVEVGWLFDGTNFVDPDVGGQDLKTELKRVLAVHRYDAETGGIIYGGLPIATDDRSKLMINGAYNKAIDENNPTATKSFKASSGFVTVDNATIIAVALAVADHVQKCFDAEKVVFEGIDNDTYTTVQAVIDAFDTTFAGL